jgi:sugar-specific transcriptional regulator TrmB
MEGQNPTKMSSKNRKFEKDLEQIGFTSKEAKVYLSLLELGYTASVSDISGKSKIARTSCYTIIDSLAQKGFIESYKLGARIRYQAKDPTKILKMIESKKSLLEEIIPLLKARTNSTGPKPKCYFYEGVEDIASIREDILSGLYKDLLVIAPMDKIYAISKGALKRYIDQEKKLGIKTKLITDKSGAASKWEEENGKSLRVTKFLPDKYESLSSITLIYGNKVCLADYHDDYPFILVIEDERIAKTQRTLFQLLWDACTTG